MQAHIKGVIFDLDGVIIDSNPVIESFWKSWTDKENITLTDAMICEWIYGRKIGDTISGLFNHLEDTRKQDIHTSAQAFDSTMQPDAIQGVVTFIQLLVSSGIPTGVVTSSHHSRMLKMLEQIGIDRNFTHFVTAHDVTHGKPHPEPYEKMREKMSVSCEHCLVFEDAISGILSARAAGMHAVGIGNEITGPGLLTAGACDTIKDFTGLSIREKKLLISERTNFMI
jgi:sugar-phosphatase